MKEGVIIRNDYRRIGILGFVIVLFLIRIITYLIGNKPLRLWQGAFCVVAILCVILYVVQIALICKNKKK